MHSDVEEVLDALGGDRDREALVYGGRRISAGEAADRTHRIAHALDGRVGPGDIVAVLTGNSPEGLVARWAVNLLGAAVTQPHEGLSATSQARIVDDVDAALVLVDAGHAGLAADVLGRTRPVDVAGLGTTGPDGTWTDLLAASGAAPADPITDRARPDDIQQIRHTGGTTGHPKGIVTTFAQHLHAARTHAALPQYRPVRMLLATPTAHAGGAIAERLLAEGATVVLQEGFDAGAFLAAIQRERITDTWLLPPLIYRLLDHPDLPGTDVSSLRTLVYGGAPANAGRISEAVRRFGPVLMQGYGQSESGGLISTLSQEEHTRPELLETVGRPVPSTEIAVCDGDGNRLPDGESGELWVHTGNAMQGYWKQPELTAATLRDGWVRTGDIAFLDDDGYLHLMDRASDVVVVVGGHVYTSELEDTLMEHAGVRQAAVFGVPDADGVESVHAAVVTGDPAPDESELAGYVAEQSGPMYVPSRITFVEEMPLTDIGKTDKKALRAALTG